MDIIKLYAAEIAEALARLNQMEKGSKEYGDLVADMDKMTNRFNEMVRANNDMLNAEEARELEKVKLEIEKMKLDLEKEKLEREAKAAELDRKAERVHRIAGYVLTGLSIGVPAVMYCWGCNKSWKWERTDTLTTMAGRESMNGILRFMKR